MNIVELDEMKLQAHMNVDDLVEEFTKAFLGRRYNASMGVPSNTERQLEDGLGENGTVDSELIQE